MVSPTVEPSCAPAPVAGITDLVLKFFERHADIPRGWRYEHERNDERHDAGYTFQSTTRYEKHHPTPSGALLLLRATRRYVDGGYGGSESYALEVELDERTVPLFGILPSQAQEVYHHIAACVKQYVSSSIPDGDLAQLARDLHGALANLPVHRQD